MVVSQIVGVDIGGTFTDFLVRDSEGRLTVFKHLSTPADPAESVLSGLRLLRERGVLQDGFLLAHGSTVATNALLERRGAKTALLLTAGTESLLAIGRQNRPHLYAFTVTKPPPLLTPEYCRTVSGRLDAQGQEIVPLDETALAQTFAALAAEDVESLAVCLLFSYLNPEHEQRVAEVARKYGFAVSLSSDIAPEPREYERASTAAANAYVAPLMERYLHRLGTEAARYGAAVFHVMQSNGGTMQADEAGKQAVKTALSGPAAGVIAAAETARQAGISHVLTFDMGGTSTDVALILDGECPVVTFSEINGLPLRTPMLAIHTVGAGGGSLIRRDAAGGIRVGPESAGAVPGPVAYGQGDRLTVTDANVLTGRLPAESRLGGSLSLAVENVRTRFAQLAQAMGTSPERAASGALEVVNTAMARALRHISVERGFDPADFTLLGFGGAGGLHVCALAEMLSVRSVLVPRYPGAFSALGLTLAPERREYIRAVPPTGPLPSTSSRLWETLFSYREKLFLRRKQEEGEQTDNSAVVTFTFWLDLRYVGQSFDLRIPFAPEEAPAQILSRFHAGHRVRYGHSDPKQPVEAVAVRLITTRPNPMPPFFTALVKHFGSPVGHASFYFAGKWLGAPLYVRESLAEGQNIPGPALILQSDATTLLLPGWTARTDSSGNLLLMY